MAATPTGDLWFQLFIVQRKLAEQMVRRAEVAGYSTLMVTTDVGVNGNRERDLRKNIGLSMRYRPRLICDGVTRPRWSLGFMLNVMPRVGKFVTTDSPDVEMQTAAMSRQMDSSFSWDEFNWLHKLWPRKLLVKGVIRPDDAGRCVADGADGVILSDHGGKPAILDPLGADSLEMQEIHDECPPISRELDVGRLNANEIAMTATKSIPGYAAVHQFPTHGPSTRDGVDGPQHGYGGNRIRIPL